MTRQRFSTLALLVVSALIVWWMILPPALGGRTTLFMTKGISMEPYINQGDVAVLRKSDDYKIGDVIAFHARSINAISLHRIVEIDPTLGIVTKGDNNAGIDLDHPTTKDIIGKNVYLFHGGAKWVELLTSMPVRIVGVGLIAWALWAAFRNDRNEEQHAQQKRRRRLPNGWRGGGSNRALDLSRIRSATNSDSLSAPRLPAIAVGALVLSVLLLILSFSRPMTTSTERTIFYTLKGKYGYSGQAGPGGEMVYRDSQVSTGEPVFTNLVDELLVTYAFDLDTMGKFEGAGDVTTEVVLQGRTGWSHTISKTAPIAFQDSAIRISEKIELNEVRDRADEISSLTKQSESQYTIAVKTNVRLSGTLNGRNFKESLPSTLNFVVDRTTVKIENGSQPSELSGPAEDPRKSATVLTGLAPLKGGEMKVSAGAPGTIQALGNTFAVATLRTIAIVAATLSLSLLVLVVLFGRRQRAAKTEDVYDEAVAQYRDLFVAINDWSRAPDQTVSIEVKSLSDLARIADSHETFVLRQDRTDGETFVVNHGYSTYRYSRPATTPAQRFGVRDEETSDQP